MSAREQILGKLRAAPTQSAPRPDLSAHYQRFSPVRNEIDTLRHWARMMRAAKTEIIWVSENNWSQCLVSWVAARRLGTLLLSDTTHGASARAALQEQGVATRLIRFNLPIEACKQELFTQVDASLTSVRCAIAATGTLVLWPDSAEPRSMSLIAPLHLALFDTRTLYPDFYSAMSREHWSERMPSNALLISGPSKTADIQLTLAYGAHGPRELVVFAQLPPHIDAKTLEEIRA